MQDLSIFREGTASDSQGQATLVQGADGRPEREYDVLRVSTKHDTKRVVVVGTAGQAEIKLHRYALVGPGDRIRVREGLQRRVWLVSGDSSQPIPISPSFEKQHTISFAGEDVTLRFIEPLTAEDHLDYLDLEGFHYRGLDFSSPDKGPKKGTGGRRVVLLAQLSLGGRWTSVGYIELQMPLLMAKPRHIAFDRPFRHPSGVHWDNWKRGGQKYVNRLVRIARTVIHPEYRGGQLSAKLVEAAMQFSRERWHIAGQRPLFLEISAEMLRHIDFVSRSGFHYLGETEGNRARVAKDLNSIRRGAKGESGIMSVQRKYYAAFEEYRRITGETFEALQARVAELLALPDPFSAMTKGEWLALRPVIRSPIPYYVVGLDDAANSYVKEAALPKPAKKTIIRSSQLEKIEINGVEVWSNYDIPQTQYNRLVMSGFGISAEKLVQRLTGRVELSVSSGSIVFVAGASGCGKSLFLANIDPGWAADTITIRGEIRPSQYKVGWLRPFPDGASLFEYLAERHGAEKTFDALARVGLSEALLFLKPFDMLSRGQRYRAMLADLILGDDDVWLIDEFCSDLDPLSARIVASRLHRIVREEGRIAFVAAANHGHFIRALRPSRVIILRTGREAIVGTGKDYIDGILQ